MSFVDKVKQMVEYAKEHKLLLLVSEIRYALAGIPDEITEEYISFPAGSIEIGSTGKLGEYPDEWEKNPYPKIVLRSSMCFVEFIKDPTQDPKRKK